ELAISESQERMAIVVDPKDVDKMLQYADEENLEAVVVATVTAEPRMVISWRGKEVVNLSRRFIDTNGAHQETTVKVELPEKFDQKNVKESTSLKERWLDHLSDLNVCSQKGLVEMFDSTIGAGSVVMPYGGETQMTPTQSMIGQLPTLTAKCDTVTIMSYGYDPYLSSWSPFHGTVYAVVDSVAKVVAAGGDVSRVRLTFQEYFKKLGKDPYRWGQPFVSLLGAYDAQMGLKLPAIGGKDSMSGTFNDIDVPPTLCSFAVGISDMRHVVTPELKCAGNYLYLLEIKPDTMTMPNYRLLTAMYKTLHNAISRGAVKSAYAVGFGGIAEAVSKMAFGNRLGVCFDGKIAPEELFEKKYGAIVVEVENCGELPAVARKIGRITDKNVFEVGGETIGMDEMLKAWTSRLEDIFPTQSNATSDGMKEMPLYKAKNTYLCKHKVAKPKVFIPTFPGTNCEYDSARAFLRAGAEVETLVFRNQNANQIGESVDAFARAIGESQIVMVPGGFSAGDEPEGSAKFITSVFRNPQIADAVMRLLKERDGLMLGICNGFQALVKLGLVPYGEIRPQNVDSPTLTFNTIGRHQSMIAHTKVVSNLSPWLQQAELGKSYVVPVSHGEGRFVAPQVWIDQLFANGQVATQYVNLKGEATMEEPYNMNGSYMAIEGITSPDGRVLGKMAHSERRREGTYLNIYGCQDQRIFESGVEYFK
ncbi:MAG: phosphoribosylformylglycinamidine synthase subunit PurQ, partial [Bacteroidales bacterium]|nr:phosphoribosylformylglycinamidine synthase subunit PurQ [Bacteroidales bacterium]